MPGGPGLSGGCVTIERLGPTPGNLGQPEVLIGVRSHLSGPRVLSPGAEVGGGTSQPLLPLNPPHPLLLRDAHLCSQQPPTDAALAPWLSQSPRPSLSVVDDRRSLDVGESC